MVCFRKITARPPFGPIDGKKICAHRCAENCPRFRTMFGPKAVAACIFEGKTMEAVSHLNPDQVTADLNARFVLKFRSNGKLFVGVCWGGRQTSIATNRGSGGAFVFIWRAPEKDAMARIQSPSTASMPGMKRASTRHPRYIIK